MNRLCLLTGIILFPCMLMAGEAKEYTDYIDGKWYRCNAAVVDAAGDTVYKRDMFGLSDKYKYDYGHKIVFHENSFGTQCFYSYSDTGKELEESCNNNKGRKSTYDHLDRPIVVDYGNYSIVSEYDGDFEYPIREKAINKDGTVMQEVWYEYDLKKNIQKWIYSDGREKLLHKDGIEIYQKHSDGTESWYDDKGYLIRHKDQQGKERRYNNKYDSKGRIIYDGMEQRWYRYLSKLDTSYQCFDERKK